MRAALTLVLVGLACLVAVAQQDPNEVKVFGKLNTGFSNLPDQRLRSWKFEPMPIKQDKDRGEKETYQQPWGLPQQPTGPTLPQAESHDMFNHMPGMEQTVKAALIPHEVMGVRTDTESWLQRDIHPNLIPAPRKETQPLFYRPVFALVKTRKWVDGQRPVNVNSNQAPVSNTMVPVGSLKTKFVDLIDPTQPNTGPQSWSILNNPSIPTPPMLAEAPMPPQPPKPIVHVEPTREQRMAFMEIQQKAETERQAAIAREQLRQRLAQKPVPTKTVTTTTYYSNPYSPIWPNAAENPHQTPVYASADGSGVLNPNLNFKPQARIRHGSSRRDKRSIIVPALDMSKEEKERADDIAPTRYPYNEHDKLDIHRGFRNMLNYNYKTGKASAEKPPIHRETSSITPVAGFNDFQHILGRYRGFPDKTLVNNKPKYVTDEMFTEVGSTATTTGGATVVSELDALNKEEAELKQRLILEVQAAESRLLGKSKHTAKQATSKKMQKPLNSKGKITKRSPVSSKLVLPAHMPPPPTMAKSPAMLEAEAAMNPPVALVATEESAFDTSSSSSTEHEVVHLQNSPVSVLGNARPLGFPDQSELRRSPFPEAKQTVHAPRRVSTVHSHQRNAMNFNRSPLNFDMPPSLTLPRNIPVPPKLNL